MALFPPVVASSMPAFDIKQGQVKIYYTISNYNQQDSIQNVHVSVRRQDSNVNIVNNNSEILIKPFERFSEEDQLFNRYCVIINNKDLSENFEADVIYKVQLRFSGVSLDQSSISAKFFTDNIENFSEWSTVCLIKPINTPIFYIDDFHYDSTDDYGQEEDAEDTFLNSFADFIGVYKQADSSEVLKSWRLRLYDADNNLLKDSGQTLVSVYNYTLDSSAINFKCSLPYEFKNEQQYHIVLDILTKNNYSSSKTYYFQSTSLSGAHSDFQLTDNSEYVVNEEEGYIKLFFSLNNSQIHNLVIRRSDSTEDFLNWQDLKIFQGENQTDFLYYDFTVESGIAYKYLIQIIDERGHYTYHAKVPITFVVEWEHAFLLEKSDDKIRQNTIEDSSLKVKQLKLKYDFQISSYKTNITENLTTTIGSKYPYIRRNGSNYYRSFPITGTITYYMDNVDFFTTKEKMFGNTEAQESFNVEQNKDVYTTIPSSYNYIYERKFREQVEKFLYNNKPKLYKSTQEGNILIKLMEVSLTPKTELDRMIYSFSATAYEIGEPSIQNLCFYGFITKGLIDPSPTWEDPVIGQISSYESDDNLYGKVFKAGEDIIGGGSLPVSPYSIATKYHYKESRNDIVLDDFYLNHLKIVLESDPYLIIQDSPNHYRIYDDIDIDGQDNIDFGPVIKNPLYRLESTYTDNKQKDDYNVYLGYLFEINGEPIIISSNGIYEFKDKNLKLSSSTTIVPQKDCLINLDYNIYKTIITDLSSVPTRITVKTTLGQLIGSYNENNDLIKIIKNKYNTTLYTTNQTTNRQEKIVQKVIGIPSVSIEAEPGTIINIKTNEMNLTTPFIMNETGVLNIDFSNEEDSNIFIEKISVIPKEGSLLNVTDVIVFYTIKTERKYYHIL